MKKVAILVVMLVLGLAGCSSAPPPSENQAAVKPKAEAPPDFETGRTAFQRMYAAARLWQPDAQGTSIASEYVKGAPVDKGEEATWQAFYASPSRRQSKSFTWIGTGKPDDRGVSPGHESDWSPSNTSTMAFDMNYLKVDTDKAFAVAQEHGGKKLTSKDPNQAVNFQCDWNPRERKLIWHVIYGTSGDDTKLRISVDASTGEFLRVEK